MKKHEFSLRMLILILCASIGISVFCTPENQKTASAQWEELRGVWVSTVANIDFPTKQTKDVETLKYELTDLIKHCKVMGFNSVFFQVRPASDAFYASEIFPWSRYLTGKQGVAPNDGFDPLAFLIDEAHKNGIELHAWINPYRITNSASDNKRLAPNNPAVLRPELVVYGSDGKMYYNPGENDSIKLIVDGAVEIAQKYDVDGIHMDDYFYPEGGFNDDGTYSFYKDQYANKADWRRAMVNKLVRDMDEAVHQVKPDIEFGVSPRGIWANASDVPGGSATKGGGSYNSIYADSKAWVENGWVDYIMPQIYWNIGYKIADYSILADWWSNVVANTDVRLYIGEGAYRTTSNPTTAWKGENGTNELRKHIEIGRSNSNISGYCMFTYHNFMDNSSIYKLMQEVNAQPSVKIDVSSTPVEEMPPIDTTPAEPPVLDESPVPSEPETPVEQDMPVTPPSLSDVTEWDKPSDGTYVNKFTDMDNYWWAMDAINALASQGIIRGRSETKFDPDSPITRADNTVLLLRVLGEKATFTENFDDVYPGAYYYNEIGMARELGIAKGYGNNLFDPDNQITRQDMATLAYRILQEENVMTSIPSEAKLNKLFVDANQIDYYARTAVAACVDAGLMSGTGDGYIHPLDHAKRFEVALFMYRIQNLIQAQKVLVE